MRVCLTLHIHAYTHKCTRARAHALTYSINKHSHAQHMFMHTYQKNTSTIHAHASTRGHALAHDSQLHIYKQAHKYIYMYTHLCGAIHAECRGVETIDARRRDISQVIQKHALAGVLILNQQGCRVDLKKYHNKKLALLQIRERYKRTLRMHAKLHHYALLCLSHEKVFTPFTPLNMVCCGLIIHVHTLRHNTYGHSAQNTLCHLNSLPQ